MSGIRDGLWYQFGPDCGIVVKQLFTEQLTQGLSLAALLSIITLLDSESRKSWRLKESQEHDGEGGEP